MSSVCAWVDQAARLADLLAAWLALTAVLVTALKLASTISAACLLAFWTDSKALLAALIADFTRVTAFSLPAGAVLSAPSTTDTKPFCRSANWLSAVLVTSAVVAAAMSYR